MFGGGLISTAVKHDRMDQATDQIHQAGLALDRLGAELHDVAVAAPTGVEVGGLTRTLDLWFDNLFTDLAVHDHIHGTADQVRRTTEEVRRARELVGEQERETRAELDRLAAARERLLGG